MAQVLLDYKLDNSKDSIWLTATPSQAAKSSIAYVQELGDFISGPDYFTVRENLPSYLIKLCISGEGLLDYDKKTYTVSPGQVFWIDCMSRQYYRTSPKKGEWHILWVHFFGPTCEAYYNMFLSQNNGSNLINTESDVTIKTAIETLISLYASGCNNLVDDIHASSILTQLMARCISAASENGVRSRLPDYIIDTRNYINNHYTERVTLETLSHELSINKFYLQKLFKRFTGLSPNEYLTQTRLTRAKLLLRTTSEPVNQISMDVGISNIGHFINLFKQYEGITPGAYRHRWYACHNNPVESEPAPQQ